MLCCLLFRELSSRLARAGRPTRPNCSLHSSHDAGRTGLPSSTCSLARRPGLVAFSSLFVLSTGCLGVQEIAQFVLGLVERRRVGSVFFVRSSSLSSTFLSPFSFLQQLFFHLVGLGGRGAKRGISLLLLLLSLVSPSSPGSISRASTSTCVSPPSLSQEFPPPSQYLHPRISNFIFLLTWRLWWCGRLLVFDSS